MLGGGGPTDEDLEMLDTDWARRRLHEGGFRKGAEMPSGRAQVVGARRARGYRTMPVVEGLV
jgi:hypothetical protein